MPTFRPDLDGIITYNPGKPIEEVSRELGIEDIVKLASNESPTEPFPEVQSAIAAATGTIHRYPETTAYYLTRALAAHHGIDPDSVWVGPGSTSLLLSATLATVRPGASVVVASPSFVMYSIAAATAGGDQIAVPLDADHRHDPDAMAAAIRNDTVVLFYCNPNNPTGTHSPAADVARLVDLVPERVLILIDEAYAEYVTAPDYASAIPHALARDNVVVTRTFSKVYGLAGVRIGYAVGRPETLEALRRPQVPFATSTLAQIAAIEALRHPDRVVERVKENAIGRELIATELRARGLIVIDSQTNFVLWRPSGDPAATASALLHQGVIVRPMGPWIRVSVGTERENRRFLDALDIVPDTTG